MRKVSLFTVFDKKMLQTFYPESWTPFSGAQRLSGLLEVCTEKCKVILRNQEPTPNCMAIKSVTMKKLTLKLLLIVLSTAVYFALVLTTKFR